MMVNRDLGHSTHHSNSLYCRFSDQKQTSDNRTGISASSPAAQSHQQDTASSRTIRENSADDLSEQVSPEEAPENDTLESDETRWKSKSKERERG